MNGVISNKNVVVEDCIYTVRGVQVMLASDVARLYNTETKKVNQVVKRNLNRFPEEFCFRLTEKEYLVLRSQFVTSNKRGGTRYLPYVFTEHGVMILSSLLKNDIAAAVNVRIIKAFVAMRNLLHNGNFESRLSNVEQKIMRLDKKQEENEERLNEIFTKFEETKNNYLFFEGQIYDAYSLLIDILNGAKESIVLIDNYVDKKILDVLSKVKKKVIVVTKKVCESDLCKYEQQYNNMIIKYNDSFHDRFIILDEQILYHSGASFKDLGKKCFALNKIESTDILKQLLNKINISTCVKY